MTNNPSKIITTLKINTIGSTGEVASDSSVSETASVMQCSRHLPGHVFAARLSAHSTVEQLESSVVPLHMAEVSVFDAWVETCTEYVVTLENFADVLLELLCVVIRVVCSLKEFDVDSVPTEDPLRVSIAGVVDCPAGKVVSVVEFDKIVSVSTAAVSVV